MGVGLEGSLNYFRSARFALKSLKITIWQEVLVFANKMKMKPIYSHDFFQTHFGSIASNAYLFLAIILITEKRAFKLCFELIL